MVAQWHELTDSQWEVIKEFLPLQRKRKHCLRQILNGMFWLLRTGAQWRNLDKRFPRWTAVYYYFYRWSRDGTLEKVNQSLVAFERGLWEKEREPSLLVVDSQSIKAVPFTSQDKGLDAHKKINGRKRHILVDTLGLIHQAHVSGAHCHDGTEGKRLLKKFMRHSVGRVKKIIADRGYRGRFARYATEQMQVTVQITKPPAHTTGFQLIPKRWVVERTFAWTTFFRRLSKDYEKTKESSAAMLDLMNSWIIISRIEQWPG